MRLFHLLIVPSRTDYYGMLTKTLLAIMPVAMKACQFQNRFEPLSNCFHTSTELHYGSFEREPTFSSVPEFAGLDSHPKCRWEKWDIDTKCLCGKPTISKSWRSGLKQMF